MRMLHACVYRVHKLKPYQVMFLCRAPCSQRRFESSSVSCSSSIPHIASKTPLVIF